LNLETDLIKLTVNGSFAETKALLGLA